MAPPSEGDAGVPQQPFSELEELWRLVSERLGLRGVSGDCRRCGRCCRFEDGIVLCATKLERACLFSVPPPRPAELPGVCPYLVGSDCSARERRTLGCRTYFCRGGDSARREELHEEMLHRLADISSRHGIDWDYAPVMERLSETGRTPPAP